MWIIGLMALSLLLLGTGKARARSGTGGDSDGMYGLQFWKGLVAQRIALFHPRLNLDFVMAWMKYESGGNPCAIGEPGDLAPDGLPREIGLGQMYNPDDFIRLRATPDTIKLSSATMRAYCQRGTAQRTRELTGDELIEQVESLLAQVDSGFDKATTAIKANGLGDGWNGTADFWMLAKADHALPGLINIGLPAVVKKLGHAPKDWNEYRTALGMDGKDPSQITPRNPQGYKHFPWHRALNMCEQCGNAVLPGKQVA